MPKLVGLQPIQNRRPDQGFGVMGQKEIDMGEIERFLADSLQTDEQILPVRTAEESRSKRAHRTESAGGSDVKDRHGDQKEIVIQGTSTASEIVAQ